MNFKYLPTSVLVVWLLFAASIRAEENPMNDPDLQQLLKQAQEMQKSSGSPDARKKLADMESMAKQEAAQQEQEEKDEKEKLQAALKKQLERQVLSRSPIGHRSRRSSNPQVSRQKAGRRGSENRTDRHLVTHSGENSRKLASGSSRSEQSQSEP